MTNFLKSFVADESGVTAMEYGMIAALIAVVILTTLGVVGNDLNKTFTNIKTAIEAANAKG
jgi:pilus assembly protein Flp/PilA